MSKASRLLVAVGFGALIATRCVGHAADDRLYTDPITASARTALSDMLTSEATGTRLAELLGFDTSDAYHKNVEHGSDEEPGWDTIEIRANFLVRSTMCTQRAGRGTLCTVQVKFGPGWWFSRENYGPQEDGTSTYVLILLKGHFYLVSPLPQPFLSARAAKQFLGKKPFDNPKLLELLSKL